MFKSWARRTPPDGEESAPRSERRNSEQPPQKTGIFNRSSRRLSLGGKGDKSRQVTGSGRQPLKPRKVILQEVDQERKERLQLQKKVFGEEWLDECYGQVVYPNPACIELMERVSKALAKRISSPQDSEQKQQALFYLLGPEFTEQYFPRSTYRVDILEPPKMLPARKEKYLEEMTEFLKKSLDKAMTDCGYPRLYNEHSVDDELYRYLLAARSVFRQGLQKRVQQEAGRKVGDPEASLLQLVEEGGPHTRVAGNSIVTLLAKQPTKKKAFIQSLAGKKIPLPGALRRVVWTEVLASRDKSLRLRDDQSWMLEKLKLFTAALTKEAKKQRLPRVTRSRNGGAIDSAVIEAFDECQVYRPLDTDDYSMRTARILNVADVHSDNFSPCHVHHVVALRTAYRGQADLNQDSENLHVAFLLTQVTSLLLPKHDAIFAMADRALATLKDQDSFYYSHIKDSLANQATKVAVKVFPPEALDKSPSAAARLYAQLQELPAAAELQGAQLQLLTDPAVFVRKWIAQAFMGVLSVSASMWVWDQLMLGGWSADIFITVSTSILCLLRPWMLRASKYSGAKKVLLHEPGKIYTSDLRDVYSHLYSKQRLVEAPPNSNYIGPPSPPAIQLLDENGKRSPVQSDDAVRARYQNVSQRRSSQSQDRPSDRSPKQDRPSDRSQTQDPPSDRSPKQDRPSDKSQSQERPKSPAPSQTRSRDVSKKVEETAGSNKSTDAPSGGGHKEPDRRNDEPSQPRAPAQPFQPGGQFTLDMTRLLDDDDDDQDAPLPPPEPLPDSDSEDDQQKPEEQGAEEGESEPPAPFTPPPSEDEAYLPHDPATEKNNPKPCRISEAVDLYIDGIRFLPDCASICKITGRIYNIHLDDEVKAPDILAYPNILGPQKCPTFRYRLTLNDDRQFLNPDLVVMLTIHIQQQSIRLVTPLGSCLVSLFNSDLAEPLLRVGAYQIRVRHGRPKPEGGVANLKHTDMDDNKPIPALTLLYRVMPHTKEYVPAPAYESGAYHSEGCEPTTTELALIHHYCFHPEYETLTVQARAEALMKAEKEEGVGDLRRVEAYVKKKLQHRIPKGKMLAPVTDFAHFTEYDISKGVKVDIQGAFNLPSSFDDYYTLAYGEIIDSEEGEAERQREEDEKAALVEKKKADGEEVVEFEEYPSGEQRMMTSRVDMKSSPRAPQWLDEHIQSLHPPMSSTTVMIVRLFGVRLEYNPGDGSNPGEISGVDGSPISINYKNPLCWGVVQLFARGTALSGSHFVPLFEGGPPPMVQAMFRRSPAAKVLEQAVKKNYMRLLPGASLEARVWDGKIENFSELPECWHKHLLAAVRALDKAMDGREHAFESSYEKFFLEKMEEDDQFDLSRVLVESEFFRQKANVAYGEALNKALKKAGKDPMPPLPVFGA